MITLPGCDGIVLLPIVEKIHSPHVLVVLEDEPGAGQLPVALLGVEVPGDCPHGLQGEAVAGQIPGLVVLLLDHAALPREHHLVVSPCRLLLTVFLAGQGQADFQNKIWYCSLFQN